jgi:predicted hydrocarbon binding protein
LRAVDLNKKTAEVDVTDSFECLYNKDKSRKPGGQFVRGVIAGWFTQLVGEKVDAIETKCIAKGDSICTYHIQPFKT